MKNKEESEDVLTRKWIKEAGTEYPGDTFQYSILKKIDLQKEKKTVYQPVISPLGWKFILFYVASLVGLGVISSSDQPSNFQFLNKLPALKLPKLQLNLSEFSKIWPEFSPQFTLGIVVFLSFGFVMILVNLKNKQASL